MTLLSLRDVQLNKLSEIALGELPDAVEKATNNATILCNIARCLSVHDAQAVELPDGRTITRQQLYLQAIHLGSKYATAWNNLGVSMKPSDSVRLLNGKAITKPQVYLKVLEIDSNRPNAYYNLACLLRQGETIKLPSGVTVGQRELFSKTLELNPTDGDAWGGLGLICPEVGSITLHNGIAYTKQQFFIAGIDANDKSPQWNYHLGLSLSRTGVIKLRNGLQVNAVQLFVRALEGDQNFACVWNDLGAAMRPNSTVTIDNTDYTQKMCFLKAIDLEPLLKDAYANLAQLMLPSTTVQLLDGTVLSQYEVSKRANRTSAEQNVSR
jgi:tetratricopeptide (TPR) repeat protein